MMRSSPSCSSAPSSAPPPLSPPPAPPGDDGSVSDPRFERLVRRRLLRDEQLQVAKAPSQAGQPSSSTAPLEPPLSPSCGRERGTVNHAQNNLMQRLLAPRLRAWLSRQVRSSSGHSTGMQERSFCEQPWLYHFNQNMNDPSGTFFISVHPDDTVGLEVASIIAALGLSLSDSLDLAPQHPSWGVPRQPSGWQVSIGWGRGEHSDAAHLGHLILSLTLEGTCEIGIQRTADETVPDGASDWVTFPQGPGDYYAIWGHSVKPFPTMHRVVCDSSSPRLSVQFRFVHRTPPALPCDVSGERLWSVGDACQAYWHGSQGDRWYPGHIARISRDRERFDICYDDGDDEANVQKRWVRVAVTADQAHLMQTRLERNARYALGTRALGKAPATPPCSPPDDPCAQPPEACTPLLDAVLTLRPSSAVESSLRLLRHCQQLTAPQPRHMPRDPPTPASPTWASLAWSAFGSCVPSSFTDSASSLWNAAPSFAFPPVSPPPAPPGEDEPVRDMRSERLIRRRLAREEQLQSTSPATPQGEQPSSSAAATEPPLSPSCGRERGTVNQRQYDLIQRLLAPRQLAWLRRQLRGSTGLVNGTEERCFCEQPWLYHFNQNSNDPSDTFFISVHADDSVGRECVDILLELGFSLSSSLVLAPRHASWGVPRHPSGFQISLGWGRGAHSDAAHLGHMILSLTLEGTCVIGIQRAAGEEVPAGESEWIEFTQEPGSFYAIWGRSVKPSPTMHRVVCNTEAPRLSVQFRFVNRPPPAPPRDTSGERSWSVGDACQAYWHGSQGDRWYPGHIARISEDRNRFEIWYDDGDKEEDVRVAVTAEEARLMKTRLDCNERYELGTRARDKAPATPPCSPPGEAGGSGDLLNTESPVAPIAPIHLTLEDLPMVARPELSLRRHFAHQMAARGVSQAWELYWLHRRNTETDWDTDPPSTSSGVLSFRARLIHAEVV